MLSTFGAAFTGLLDALRRCEVPVAQLCGQPFEEFIAPLGEYETPVGDLRFWLSITDYHCRHLDLKSVMQETEKLRATLNADEELQRVIASGELRFRVMHLRESVRNGFRAQKFYFVLPSRVDLYDKPDLFGPEVQERFGKASFHIQEAGNCLALDRSTAAVFHLMCVLEVGLDSLASALGLPFNQASWGTIIHDCETAIAGISKATHGANWKEDKEFYSQAAVQFRFFKDAWRNHVAHARATHTEEKAASILEHVKDFMQHLAESLRERP